MRTSRKSDKNALKVEVSAEIPKYLRFSTNIAAIQKYCNSQSQPLRASAELCFEPIGDFSVSPVYSSVLVLDGKNWRVCLCGLNDTPELCNQSAAQGRLWRG